MSRYFSTFRRDVNKKRPPSLRNIGANCYLNSALQGLSSCDKFVEEINRLRELKNNRQLYEKLAVFYDLISLLNGKCSDPMEISRNPIFKNWNKPGQQDSFELLSYVLNQVYNEFRKNEEDAGNISKRDMQKWLRYCLPMRIIIHYQIKCGCGKLINVPPQSDLALHVTIPVEAKMDLQELINKFFDDDTIEDYTCDETVCSESKLAYRRTRLCRPLPKTICVHLQRTRWNGRFMQKIDNKIRFVDKLIIKSEFCVSQKQTENEISKDELQSNTDKIMDKGARADTSDGNKSISETNHSVHKNIDGDNVPKHDDPQNDLRGKFPDNSDNKSSWRKYEENDEINSESKSNVNNIGATDCTNEPSSGIRMENEKLKENACNGGDKTFVDIAKDSNSLPNDDSSMKSAHNICDGNQYDNVDTISDEPSIETRIEKQNSNPGLDNNEVSNEGDEEFNLKSVIVHYGTVYFGHYVCYKCVNNQWFLTNDSVVREVANGEVFKSNAYILFYEKP